jgi:hypothetical protein
VVLLPVGSSPCYPAEVVLLVAGHAPRVVAGDIEAVGRAGGAVGQLVGAGVVVGPLCGLRTTVDALVPPSCAAVALHPGVRGPVTGVATFPVLACAAAPGRAAIEVPDADDRGVAAVASAEPTAVNPFKHSEQPISLARQVNEPRLRPRKRVTVAIGAHGVASAPDTLLISRLRAVRNSAGNLLHVGLSSRSSTPRASATWRRGLYCRSRVGQPGKYRGEHTGPVTPLEAVTL